LETRRDFLKKAAYLTPVILTVAVRASHAQGAYNGGRNCGGGAGGVTGGGGGNLQGPGQGNAGGGGGGGGGPWWQFWSNW